jgi:phenylalanyl-tRNA synthetase beta chain
MVFSIGISLSWIANDSVMQILSIRLISPDDKSEGYWIEGHDEPTFFPGRSAIVKYRTQKGDVIQIGSFGILHPEVLANFEINYPGSAVEINLEPFL